MIKSTVLPNLKGNRAACRHSVWASRLSRLRQTLLRGSRSPRQYASEGLFHCSAHALTRAPYTKSSSTISAWEAKDGNEREHTILLHMAQVEACSKRSHIIIITSPNPIRSARPLYCPVWRRNVVLLGPGHPPHWGPVTSALSGLGGFLDTRCYKIIV